MDRSDNDPARFFLYLCSAFSKIGIPQAEQIKKELAMGMEIRSWQPLLEYLLANLESLSKPIILFVDDVYLLTDPDVKTLFNYFIDRLPKNLKVMLSSRCEPFFPFQGLKVKGKFQMIAANDLSFDLKETKAFFRNFSKLNLSHTDFQILHRLTEGWPAGLQLAALTLAKTNKIQDFLINFSSNDQDISDYLNEVVLEQLDPKLRNQLPRLAIPHQLCDSLVHVLLDSQDDFLLKDIESKGLFLIPLDRQRSWYRFHHLFRDFLIKTSKSYLDSDEIKRLHLLTSRWLEENSSWEEAIDHCLDSQNFDEAIRMMNQYALQIVSEKAQFKTWKKWHQKIPPNIMQDEIFLRIIGANVAINLLEVKAPKKELEQIEKLICQPNQNFHKHFPEISSEEFAKIKLAFSMTKILATAFFDQPQECQALAKNWVENYQGIENIYEGSVLSVLAGMLILYGEYAEANRYLAPAKDILININANYNLFWWHTINAWIRFETGRLSEAENILRQGLDDLEKHPILNIVESDLLKLPFFEVLFEQGKFEILESVYQENQIKIQNLIYIQFVINGIKTIVRKKLFEKKFQIAKKYIQLGYELAKTRLWPRLSLAMEALQLRLLIQKKDSIDASNFFNQALLFKPKSWQITQGCRQLAEKISLLAQLDYFVFQKDWSQFNRVHQELPQLAIKQMSMAEQLQVKIWESRYHFATGQEGLGKAMLKLCLQQGLTQGFVTIFIEHGSSLKNHMMNIYQSHSIEFQGCKKKFELLLNNLETKKIIEPGTFDRIIQKMMKRFLLTKREYEVLMKLNSENSIPQIAKEIFISVDTLRWHLKNIYSKLGVHHRSAAVAKWQHLEKEIRENVA